MSLPRFDVDPEDLSLLQTLTGIASGKELEEHISVVQNKANRVRRRRLTFMCRLFDQHPDSQLPMHWLIHFHKVCGYLSLS